MTSGVSSSYIRDYFVCLSFIARVEGVGGPWPGSSLGNALAVPVLGLCSTSCSFKDVSDLLLRVREYPLLPWTRIVAQIQFAALKPSLWSQLAPLPTSPVLPISPQYSLRPLSRGYRYLHAWLLSALGASARTCRTL